MSVSKITFGIDFCYSRTREYIDDELESTEYSMRSSTFVGISVDSYSKYTDSTEYRAFYKSSAYDAVLKDPSVSINKITVSGKLTGLGTQTALDVKVHAASEPISGNKKDDFLNMNNGNSVTVSAGREFEAVFTSAEDIQRILSNGVAFTPIWEGRDTDEIDATYGIFGLMAEADYYNPNEAPVVSELSAVSAAGSSEVLAYCDKVTVSWKYSNGSGVDQQAVDVEVRNETGEWLAAANRYVTAARTYQMSAASYPAPAAHTDVLYYRIRAYSVNGIPGEWAEGSIPIICPEASELSPGGGSVVLGDSLSTLRWSVKCRYKGTDIPMKTPPAEYDIQYSTNGGDTWKTLAENFTASAEGRKYYRTVYANTFPVGPVQWRVRPRLAGNPGAVWAQESFIVRVQATTSSVSCDGKPHPTVSWSSASQIAYQVRFADYDSGAVYGSATSHTIPFVYGSGVYPVQVRTQASGGEWSAWTETEYVTITNTAPSGLVELYADKTARAASLRWMIDGPADAFIVYRNDVPVYVGLARSFEDAGACGECRYYVRAVSGGNYIQSNTVALDVIPVRDCMYDTNGGRWIDLRYSTSPRSRGYTETAGVVYKYYAGRKRPVAYLDGTIDRQLTVPYAFKTKAEADLAKSALGHTVIYKDTRGNRLIGILGSVSESVQSRLILHTLTFVEVDYNEEVRYED